MNRFRRWILTLVGAPPVEYVFREREAGVVFEPTVVICHRKTGLLLHDKTCPSVHLSPGDSVTMNFDLGLCVPFNELDMKVRLAILPAPLKDTEAGEPLETSRV